MFLFHVQKKLSLFFEKTVRPQNGLLIFLWKETHSETKSWKSSRILRVKPNVFIFLFFHHFSLFFHFFIFYIFIFFIFLHFCFFFTFLNFDHFFDFFIFSMFLVLLSKKNVFLSSFLHFGFNSFFLLSFLFFSIFSFFASSFFYVSCFFSCFPFFIFVFFFFFFFFFQSSEQTPKPDKNRPEVTVVKMTISFCEYSIFGPR